MLRKTRIAAAALCLGLLALLFLDFTGAAQAWFGWLAKLQFLPALLAANVAVFAALLLVTFLFGRIYCSVLCPLGVFQDVVSRLAARGRRNRFAHVRERRWLRYGVFAVFVGLVAGGFGSLFALLAPYSAFGRMVATLLGPLYRCGNNLLAGLAARAGSYAFYPTEVRWAGHGMIAVATATCVVIAILAWRGGRTYCNTLCPVGTALGLVSRFARFRPRIDARRCSGCGACARACKSGCIDPKTKRIDASRCVACLNCLERCRPGALRYSHSRHDRTDR